MMWMAPVTGLAALNKQKYPTMGDDNKDPRGGKGKGKGNDKGNTLPAFMPGQQSSLANQLNQGFGGGDKRWNDYLRMTYSPIPVTNFVPGSPNRQNNNNSNKDAVPVGDDATNQMQPGVRQRAMLPQQAMGLLALRNGGYY